VKSRQTCPWARWASSRRNATLALDHQAMVAARESRMVPEVAG